MAVAFSNPQRAAGEGTAKTAATAARARTMVRHMKKERPFPMADHPLTLALIAGARARTHDAMRQAVFLAKELSEKLKPTEVEQCKLAAEVLIERKMQ